MTATFLMQFDEYPKSIYSYLGGKIYVYIFML